MRLFLIEKAKLKGRHIFLCYALVLLVTFFWMLWCMRDMDETITCQGYYYLLISMPMINAILLPAVLAAAESRLCDIEIKGDTLKMLYTMEPKLAVYHVKLLYGSYYLTLFCLLETAMIPLLGRLFQVRQPFPAVQVLLFFLSTFAVSFVLLLIQQPLSLLYTNQLIPMFIGIGGTFYGLFSWFFPNVPLLRYLLPWGYYCSGCSVNMNYDEATRIITYYTIPFPISFSAGLLLFGAAAYLAGCMAFMKKEV